MHIRADLALYNPGGRLTALAEVKRKLGTSGEWAARTRRNILAHGGFGDTEYFLLVTPDRLYLWKDAGTDPAEVLPDYEADAGATFAPYFESVGVDPHAVSGQAFELVVASWLGDVIRSAKASGGQVDDRSWLARSGFRAAVRGGRIAYEAVA